MMATETTLKRSTRSARPKSKSKAKSNYPSEEEIKTMISVRAYHKAEARGFFPGGEYSDWLEAEEEVKSELAVH